MRIDANGNVGIGTNIPTQKLEIDGNIKLTSGGYIYGDGSNADLLISNNSGSVLRYGNVYVKALAASVKIIATSEEISLQNNAGTIWMNGSGNVGIGTTSPSEKLDVNGNARFRSIGSGASSGALHYTSTGVLTTNTSDARLKTNLQPLENTLNKLLGINTYTFNWIDETDRVDLGMIAQEVEQIFPNLVFTNNVDGYKGIHYDKFSSILTKAIQEQQAIIETQEQKITDLETTIQSLITRIENLENK
jgi:hypothetical protein